MSVRLSLSVRMYGRGCHWTSFWMVGFFGGTIEKLQIWVKSDKNIKNFARRNTFVLLTAAAYTL
jgi:hypothetical protein